MNLEPGLVAYYQTKSHGIIRDYVERGVAHSGLSITEWRTLTAIEKTDAGVHPSYVARRLSVEIPLISVIAKKFLSRGYVSASPDPADKRAKVYTITEEGRRLLTLASRSIDLELKELFRDISEDELENYLSVLKKIITRGIGEPPRE